MKKVIIFGGTTEGKELAEELAVYGISSVYCVATEYGKQQLKPSKYIRIQSGRMDGKAMLEFFQKEQPVGIVDATHPYAKVVKEEIHWALEHYEDLPFFRVNRGEEKVDYKNCKFFDSAKECAYALEQTKGRIFLTTGSKELSLFCEKESVRNRIVARVIPGEESLRLCEEAGLNGTQIIAMQGPFSLEMNLAFMKEKNAEILVMKEGGKSGNEGERILAAQKLNIPCYIIKRPKESQRGYTLLETKEKLLELFGIHGDSENKKLQISLAGYGMGFGSITEEVQQAMEEADIIFGAKRMLAGIGAHKVTYPYYLAKDILPILRDILKNMESEHTGAKEKKVLILFSGDTGFYSGAKKMKEALEEEGFTPRILPGISSISAMASRVGETWEDAKIFSTHGVELNQWRPKLRFLLKENQKVFLITSGCQDVKLVGALLKEMENDDGSRFSVTAGMDLYGDERVMELDADDCMSFQEEGLCVLFLKNSQPVKKKLTPGVEDVLFERDEVPMSKEEVRALSLCKLGIQKEAVCFDIGSGTGSVAVEMGLLDPSVEVYAIERQKKACDLIQKNVEKFRLENVHVIAGEAPDALFHLPTPSHVFIGGSGGNMEEILQKLMDYNATIKVVINSVTLETVAELSHILKKYDFCDVDMVQLFVSKAKQAGDYHLMQGQNPVYITTFTICQKN